MARTAPIDGGVLTTRPMKPDLKHLPMTLTLAATLPFGSLLQQPPPVELIYRHAATGDLKVHAFPAAGPAQGLSAAVVWLHGGGWTGGDCASFFPMARYTAARGAASFVVEYRLVKPGGPTMADSIADCKSALRYLRGHAAELKLDPHRLALAGESAGGHLAAAVATLDGFDYPTDDRSISARPDALVLYNPCLDLGHSQFGHLVPGMAAQSPTCQRELADEYSPLAHVRPGLPPTLCLHGLADTVISPEQSRQFAVAMTQAGNRCDLALLPGLPHAFLIPNYKCSEQVVVAALRRGDVFLTSLGYFSGESNLTVSDPPAWTAKWPPAPHSSH